MNTEREYERVVGRDEAAAMMQDVVDGVAAGELRFDRDGDRIDVEVPAAVEIEIELELEDDETSVEVELEWPEPTGAAGADALEAEQDLDDAGDESPVGSADAGTSLARFEVFQDNADEWRWRLVHRNGNVIATSGEGYASKQNALKGMRSVMANSAGAEVIEEPQG